jgi:hypothetical protein
MEEGLMVGFLSARHQEQSVIPTSEPNQIQAAMQPPSPHRDDIGSAATVAGLLGISGLMTADRLRPPTIRQQLESAAVLAHQAGIDWTTFYARHKNEIGNAVPWDLPGRRRFARRLCRLVVVGDTFGSIPIETFHEPSLQPTGLEA